MPTFELDGDAYELVRSEVSRRVARGEGVPGSQADLAALNRATRVGDTYRMSVDETVARSLLDWFEKSADIIDAIREHVSDSNRLIPVCWRAVHSIRAALD